MLIRFRWVTVRVNLARCCGPLCTGVAVAFGAFGHHVCLGLSCSCMSALLCFLLRVLSTCTHGQLSG